MKRIFTLAMLSLAFHATAQQVHKCVDRSGNTAYQSAPCGHGQATARTWEAEPDPVVGNIPASAASHPVTQDSRHRASRGTGSRGRRTAGASIPVDNGGNSRACAAAKATRTRTLERVGLKRTFELLSKLDEAVRRACK